MEPPFRTNGTKLWSFDAWPRLRSPIESNCEAQRNEVNELWSACKMKGYKGSGRFSHTCHRLLSVIFWVECSRKLENKSPDGLSQYPLTPDEERRLRGNNNRKSKTTSLNAMRTEFQTAPPAHVSRERNSLHLSPTVMMSSYRLRTHNNQQIIQESWTLI